MNEQEIEWQSYLGVTYDLQQSTDLVNWTTIATFQGTGQKQSHIVQTTNPARKFQLKQTFKDGNEPLDFRAYAAWDGRYVLLQWSLYFTPLSGTYRILRDNQLIAEIPAMSYQNSYVHSQPGTGTHTYSVTYWS